MLETKVKTRCLFAAYPLFISRRAKTALERRSAPPM